MHKAIEATIASAALLLAVACAASDSSTTSEQPQATAVVPDRAEPKAAPQQQGTTPVVPDRNETTTAPQQQGPAPVVSDRGETATNPQQVVGPSVVQDTQQGAETDTQPQVSAFLRELGREYPGLLTLPECSASTQLTMAPLEDDAYEVIIPLGLLSTNHVLPTSHVFYQLVREPTLSSRYGTPAVAEVRAPGNIRILHVNSSESIGSPRGDYIDYDITFAPCRGRMYQFLHVSTLIPELEKLFEAGLTGRCNEYEIGQSQARLCQSAVQLDVPVGTVLGTTGGKVSNALDLEAYDLDGPSLGYANPARFGSEFDLRLKVVCPFDDFTADVQDRQLARMGASKLQPRTAEPRCGEVMQDIPGTAQGNWYTGITGRNANTSQELALVHDHVDPAMAAISIGGTVADAGVWLFRPEYSGLVNRDFSSVSADSQTYCYQGAMTVQGGQTPTPFPGRLLISLTSDTEMLVEQQGGGCGDGAAFVDPVTYKR